MSEPVASKRITVEVNGETYEHEVEARRLLVHFLRDDLELTGTHIGCDTGNCGNRQHVAAYRERRSKGDSGG